MHKRHSSCPSIRKDDVEKSSVEKTNRGAEGKKSLDKLHQVKKMHSFNRRLKNCHEYKNPDAQEATPSYMRQTCASLIKRNTFKARSIFDIPEAKPRATQNKPPRYFKKKTKNTPSPEQTSDHISEANDEQTHQEDDTTLQFCSDEECSDIESGTMVSEDESYISPTTDALTQKTDLADASERTHSDLDTVSLDGNDSEDKPHEDPVGVSQKENPVLKGDEESTESQLEKFLDELPSPFLVEGRQQEEEDDLHQRDPPKEIHSHKLEDIRTVSSELSESMYQNRPTESKAKLQSYESKEKAPDAEQGNFEIRTGGLLHTIGSNALVGFVGAALCAIGIPSTNESTGSMETASNDHLHQGWSLEQDDLFFRSKIGED
eukprot:g8184.t1